MRRLPLMLLSLLVLTLTSPTRASSDQDRWYVVTMQGEKIGYMVDREESDAGRTVSITRMHMRIGRGEQVVELDIETRFLERDGEPVEMVAQQRYGAVGVTTTYEFEDDSVVVKTKTGDQETELTQPLPPDGWLTPLEAKEFVARRLEAGAEEITYTTLDPMLGLQPMELSHRVIGETKVEVLGKTVPAIEWEILQVGLPGTTREFVDHNGELLRGTVDFGGFNVEFVAASEEFAKQEFSAPEIMRDTFVRLDGPIDNARSSRRGVYVLRDTKGAMPELPREGVQRVDPIDKSTIRVTIDLDDNRPAKVPDSLRQKALGASAMINPEDEKIVALTDRALDEAGMTREGDPLEIAHALERFVGEHVDYKGLGVGFATASEVCRTGEGDCSEHAVLLCAMLRSAGIPSRAVTGLVYADGFMGERHIFGYHMWSQALVETDGEERWIDVDAAIHSMDATHIALSHSTMTDEDPVSAMINMVSIFGSLDIGVESVE